MSRRERPWTYYDVAVSLCPTCLRKVEGKIVFQDGSVYMDKRCPEHGPVRVLLADDVEYWRRAREVFLKRSEMPQRFQTPVEHGCPYDCGLCADHEQHACLALVEITDRCNLTCPICYADSGPGRGRHRTLDEIERMLDAVVHAEGEPDVVQISGGEPTVHPEFFRILDLARERPIRHLMVNTNGVRIAKEDGFAERLATYMPGFELYLQFDSLRPEPLLDLRGEDLRAIHERALDRLDALDLSTTLVVTVKRGVNDDQIGELVDYALTRRCVRGVTFQPVQVAGRTQNFDPARNRLTLSEVRRRLLEQTDVFRPEDVIPVPCHPDAIAMAYALKLGDSVHALTGLVDPDILIHGGRSTIALERDPALHQALAGLFSAAPGPEAREHRLRDLLCCLPQVEGPDGLSYRNVFRVIILQFLDAWSLDVRSVKRACVQIVHPDGRLVPFDTYNLLYRGSLEADVLEPLRRATAGGAPA